MSDYMTLTAASIAGAWTPETSLGLAANHSSLRMQGAPKPAVQGTAVPFAGSAAVLTRGFVDLGVTDANPGSPPREAPV